MTPSLAPAVSPAASEPPAAKRHRAVFTNLLLARSLTASPRQRTKSLDFQGISMGGTGLEPVTPSLSRRPRRSRLLAGASESLLPCRDLTLQRRAAFAPVCTLFRRLVIARGSTVGA